MIPTIKKLAKGIGNYFSEPWKFLRDDYDSFKEFKAYIVPNANINGEEKTAVLRTKLGLEMAIRTGTMQPPLKVLQINGTRPLRKYKSNEKFIEALKQPVEDRKSKLGCVLALNGFSEKNNISMKSQEIVLDWVQPSYQGRKRDYSNYIRY